MKKLVVSFLFVFLSVFILSNQANAKTNALDIQLALKQLGYNVTVDGVYGASTKYQVSRFQTDQGLTPTGDADSDTIMKLNSLVENIEMNNISSTVEDKITYVQSALKSLGYNITVDGVFGKQTQTALKSFQKKKGLNATGLIDSKTLDALKKAYAGNENTYSDVTKVSKAPSSGYWIVINKTTNRLTLFKGKSVVKTYPVATGKTTKLTPEGKFTVVVKAVDPSWGGNGHAKPVKGGDPKNPLGKRWLGLNIGGGGQYGIHGNNNPKSIGTYASAGCVRMYNDDVVELYDMISKKTPVWIGTQKQLTKWGVN